MLKIQHREDLSEINFESRSAQFSVVIMEACAVISDHSDGNIARINGLYGTVSISYRQ